MIFYLLILTTLGAGLVNRAQAAETSVADSIRKYRFLAASSRKNKAYDEAIKYYREYLKYKSDDVKAHYRLGELCFKTKDYAGAKQALNGAVNLDSLHVNSNILLYNLHIRDKGHADSAAICLERFLLVRPDDVEKRRGLADLYRRRGEVKRAIAHYEQLVEKSEEAEELIELLAVLNEDIGEAARALEWRQRLVADGGADGLDKRQESLEKMLRLQLETSALKSAFETLLQLAQIDSAGRYSYYSRIASLAEKHDDKRMLQKGWEGMVKANSRDLETVATLVEWHLNEEKVEAASQWLAYGLRVNLTDAHLQLLKGDILVLQEGDEEEAIAAFEQARTDPRWESIAQQRIWQLRPPETEEEKLIKAFFGKNGEEGN